jgi:hypothetical protein
MYNGFDWYGRTLEVREVTKLKRFPITYPHRTCSQDRYAGLSGPGAFRGGFRGLGGPRGMGGRGLRGGLRGSFRGGYASQGPSRDFSSQDIYADYPGPDQSGGHGGHGGLRMDSFGGSYGGGYGYIEPDPSQQIMVRNVSCPPAVLSVSTPNVYLSCHGRLPMRIWWSCSRPQDRLNLRRFCSTGRDPRDVASYSLPKYRRQRPPSVRFSFHFESTPNPSSNS